MVTRRGISEQAHFPGPWPWLEPHDRIRLGSLLGLISLGALLFSGCASQVRIAPPLEAPATSWTTPKGHSWKIADSLFALRADLASARQAEAAYTKANIEQADVPQLLTQWSHACYVVALYGNLEPNRRRTYFRRGVEAGEAAMRLHHGFARIYAASEDEAEAVAALDGPFLEAAYWTAVNEGRLLVESDRYVRKGLGEQWVALVRHLLIRDDTLFYGGPHRLAGAMALRISDAEIQEAKAQFQMAQSIGPRYAGNWVTYAEFFTTATNDRVGFSQTLEAVISDTTWTKSIPENELERKRAVALLQQVETLFPVKATRIDP